MDTKRHLFLWHRWYWKKKGSCIAGFFQWFLKKPPSPQLWALFFCSSVQSKLLTPHAMPLHELMSHLLKTSRHFMCWLESKLIFPSLVPAADSKSPQAQKVISHLKLFLGEHRRHPWSTEDYPWYSHPALLLPISSLPTPEISSGDKTLQTLHACNTLVGCWYST